MLVRIPREKRLYAVLRDGESVVLILGGYGGGQMGKQPPLVVLDGPDRETYELIDDDVLLYVSQPELATGEAVARLADEYELMAPGDPGFPQTPDEAEKAAEAAVHRIAGLDASLGSE